jgi:hypothetical protein
MRKEGKGEGHQEVRDATDILVSWLLALTGKTTWWSTDT